MSIALEERLATRDCGGMRPPRDLRAYPARIVVRKSSNFSADEIDGLTRAARDLRIDTVDLVTVMHAKLHLCRDGLYPSYRDTRVQIDESRHILTPVVRSGITRRTRVFTSPSRWSVKGTSIFPTGGAAVNLDRLCGEPKVAPILDGATGSQ